MVRSSTNVALSVLIYYSHVLQNGKQFLLH
jgi:hypothetical protein